MASCKICGNNKISMNCICSDCMNETKMLIHGHWSDKKCSICRCENEHNTKFCPNCGAKMDGEKVSGKYVIKE